MAVADIMDDIDYKTINFNVEEAEFRHPLWMTESHFVYNLYRDNDGHLNCHRNPAGEPICSPRFVNYQYSERDGQLNCHRSPAGGA